MPPPQFWVIVKTFVDRLTGACCRAQFGPQTGIAPVDRPAPKLPALNGSPTHPSYAPGAFWGALPVQMQMLRKPTTIVTRAVGSELVLLDLAKGTYFTLDEVGSTVWRHLESGLSLDAIAEAICAEYEVERHIVEADLERLVNELRAAGLLEAS